MTWESMWSEYPQCTTCLCPLDIRVDCGLCVICGSEFGVGEGWTCVVTACPELGTLCPMCALPVMTGWSLFGGHHWVDTTGWT